MKNNLRRLSKLLQLFGYDAFYTSSISDYTVNVQGNSSPKTLAMARKLKFKVKEINDNGYLTLIRGGDRDLPTYTITLT